MTSEATFWNGQPVTCRRVLVVVAEPVDLPGHWLHGTGLVGKTIAAVEVPYWQGTMYLYDEDGSGWRKVTEGHGGPSWPHRNISVERIVGPAQTPASSAVPAPDRKGSSASGDVR